MEGCICLRYSYSFIGLETNGTIRPKSDGEDVKMEKMLNRTTASRVARINGKSPVLIGLFLVALLFPLFSGPYWLDVGFLAVFYIVLGLGLNIVVGYAGLLDLGYSAFFAVGA